MYSFVSTLSGVQRFSLLKLVHRENVLEHTGMVVIFALCIVQELNSDLPPEKQIEIEEVLVKAIVHDWDEVITGDIVRPTKYFSETLRRELKKLEQHGINKIAEALSFFTLPELHSTAKDGVTGYVVALADLLAAVHRVWEEVCIYNNHHMIVPAKNMLAFLEKMNASMPTLPDQTQEETLRELLVEAEEILLEVCETPTQLKDLANAD